MSLHAVTSENVSSDPFGTTTSTTPAADAVVSQHPSSAPGEHPDHAHLVKSYWKNGWAVARNVFSPAEVDKLAQEAQNVASSRLAALAEALQSSDEQVRRQAEHTKTLTVDDDDDGRSNNERGGRRLQFVAPRKLESPCQDPRCPSFRRVINDRRLVERVAAILGQQSVMPAAASAVASGDNDEKLLLLLEQCFMKPPVVGSAKPFHQDNYFFEISPTDAVVTAWIALDDAVVGNGCLEYLSGLSLIHI